MAFSRSDREELQSIAKRLIAIAGDDPLRDGLIDTPRRFAAWWEEFFDHRDDRLVTVFPNEVRESQMIVVSGIELWSMCEHHVLPFSATVAIAVIPRDTVLGLSKFARIATKRAHALQTQERLAEQIADSIRAYADTPDVAVTISGAHLCLALRGVRSAARMTTTVVRGAFRDEPAARAEFLGIVAGAR